MYKLVSENAALKVQILAQNVINNLLTGKMNSTYPHRITSMLPLFLKTSPLSSTPLMI
jgi:hypothetical protein